jgi:pyruvate/2-oxoglutarate dehydrogenase complex dihydrolipoamide acyltransferase (E2) component
MSALNTLSKVSSAVQTRVAAYGLANYKRRWLHKSSKCNAIMMPAMSPLMTEGTITRWKRREGEAFAVGDVLLQIASDLYVVDVQAQRPGIMGKILMPDGSSNVPVEQVIALVAQDSNELFSLQLPSPMKSNTPSTSTTAPSTATNSPLASPRHMQFSLPLSSPHAYDTCT